MLTKSYIACHKARSAVEGIMHQLAPHVKGVKKCDSGFSNTVIPLHAYTFTYKRKDFTLRPCHVSKADTLVELLCSGSGYRQHAVEFYSDNSRTMHGTTAIGNVLRHMRKMAAGLSRNPEVLCVEGSNATVAKY